MIPVGETIKRLRTEKGITQEEPQGQEQIAGANQRIVFCENLNRYMRQRGVTQADIVSGLGFSASTVSDWATGKKYPRVEAMEMLADKLGVQITDLTRSHNEPKEEGDNRMNLITLDDLLVVASARFLQVTVTLIGSQTAHLEVDASDLAQWTRLVELFGSYEVREVAPVDERTLGISLTPPRRPEA